ncbi:MAG: DUF2213 domain-containing protein [Myxococcaceae bacterium]|nr:MAG: DUF2213 domain-containing protein [Myxococcaceae bacterium]
MRVTRFNFAGTTRGVRPTPQGGLCVEAAVARTGVLQYGDGSGRTWLEYRPESEVFAADSLASLRGAPVTDEHPAGLVTPETFTAVSRGHTADDVRRDGDFVVADLLVQDGALCRKVDAGERREVSCGYTCEVDPTPGVTPEGDRYDAVQRNIRHNHVALLAPGEGRSGPEVALRMDGAAVEVRRDAAGESMKKITLKSGRVIKLDAAEDEGAAQAAVEEVEKKADGAAEAIAQCDAVQTALTDAMTQNATLKAKLAAMEATKPAAPEVTEEMVPDEVLDAALAKRIALHDEARKVLGAEAKMDGLKPAEIRAKVIAQAFPSVKLDGLSADRVQGLYDAALLGATEHNDGLANAHRAAAGADPETRTDDADAGTPKGLARRTQDAWRRPSTMTATGAAGATGSR